MSTTNRPSKKKRGIAWPVGHVLALAPLDTWMRMLAKSGGVSPRYWGRLGGILLTSLVGTACTAHERIALRVLRKRKLGPDPRIEHEPGTLIILGYYRSGTTHLHNLMGCDDRFITPRWYQCLAGQGFVFGWSMIRFVLVPFLGQTRPQDGVGFGPSWPGEDDFALCTWGGCSSIPGRLIWPSQWEDWKRWHGLEGLNEKELNRWRSLMAMFVWKLTRGSFKGKKNRSRIVLLKTPSHTARVAELDRLFNGNVKFVHLVREPGAVIDSNVRLHDALKSHLLEDAPDVQTIRDRIVEEYAYTQAKCCDELAQIDPQRFVRVRYQDLRNDGAATLKAIYQTLGLGWDQQVEQSVGHYLASLGDYVSNNGSKNEPIEIGAVTEREQALRREMTDRHGLDAPAVDRVEVVGVQRESPRIGRGILAAVMLTIGCIALWLLIAWSAHAMNNTIHLRLIPAVWLCGAVIGIGTRRASGQGSRLLASIAAILTIFVVLSTAFPVAVINYNYASTPGYSTQDWIYHNSKYAYQGLRSGASVVFITLGAMTAYRHARWTGASPPNTSKKEQTIIQTGPDSSASQPPGSPPPPHPRP